MAPKRKKDAHRRCHCKNTNCLKRYCACFAAENFCTEDCSCKECFNQLDNEKKVDNAREEAKFRNPFAFSTKEGERKSGCECRVRKCWSDVCKCYRANVECGSQCRCVGCENVDGERGDDFGMMIESSTKESDMDEDEFVSQLIQSPDETSNLHDMMIGTSSRDSDIVHVDRVEFVFRRELPQEFNARQDERKKTKSRRH